MAHKISGKSSTSTLIMFQQCNAAEQEIDISSDAAETRIGKIVDVEIERYEDGNKIAGLLSFEVLGEPGHIKSILIIYTKLNVYFNCQLLYVLRMK